MELAKRIYSIFGLKNSSGTVIDPSTEDKQDVQEITLNAIVTQQTDKSQMTQITNGTIEADIIAVTDDTTDLNGQNGIVNNAILNGRINSTETKPLRIDASTHSLQQLSYEHHEIHAGSHFYICDYQTLTNGDTREFTIVTPASTKEMHMTFTISGTYAVAIEIYDGATVDTPGDPVDSYNNNRVLAASGTGATIREGDTFDPLLATLTPIYRNYAGANKQAGFLERSREIVLDTSNTYVFVLTNGSISNNVISYCAEWYEHTPKD